ncbi:MAG TPA: DHH family phosphoesterase [Candidatus Saccharimonadales bacterium]|nr:DHH family phosphoesterase [Candidatus Saccharimonadales bacterium]
MSLSNIKKLGELVAEAKTILILQPEKPDTDSLTTSLALEHILGDMDKQVILYCQDDVPVYISYFPGADRVTNEFPRDFDLTILVDTGGPQQLGRTLEKYQALLVKKPFAILDHHANREAMPFETINVIGADCNATCELILNVSKELGWKINAEAAQLLIPGILADTRNMSIPAVTAKTFRSVADIIDLGADVFKSHEAFRATNVLEPDLVQLKGRLLARMELFCDGKIALLIVTPEELKQYADIHDPADLVIYDMQNAKGVEVAVVLRNYGGQFKKVKISTRANMPVAAKACGEFGGGGHDRAAGAQVNDRPIAEVKDEFVKVLCKHIRDYEADQHTN